MPGIKTEKNILTEKCSTPRGSSTPLLFLRMPGPLVYNNPMCGEENLSDIKKVSPFTGFGWKS